MNWKFPYYDIDFGIDWKNLMRDIPIFTKMNTTPQDSIWHAEGCVLNHIYLVINSMEKMEEFKNLPELEKHILITSVLFHDIEKHSVTTTTRHLDGTRDCIIAPRHAQLGEKTTREILYKELNVPFKVREEICALVRYHGVPLWSIDDGNIHSKLINISQRCRLNLLAMLAIADVKGRICEDTDVLLEKIEFFKELAKENYCYVGAKIFSRPLQRYKTLNDKTYNPQTRHIPYDESKFHVHMVAGIAGSGKDYYINNELNRFPIVSLDDLRRKMKIKPTDKKGNGRVLQLAQEDCKVQMRLRKDFVFNATNITNDMRSKWTRLFESYGGRVTIHYIEVPYETLTSQNKKRDYIVPLKIIDKMVHKLEIPQYNEAFDVKYITK